jgi:predicted PurR-regulated permease PerM
MLHALEGAGVLLLLSVFFAYVIAPAVVALRTRIRIGPRRRPIATGPAILLIYLVLFVPVLLGWRSGSDSVRRWVNVTAPTTVDRLFHNGNVAPIEAAIRRAPLSDWWRGALTALSMRMAGALEREARRTLAACIEAAPYAGWLAVCPVIAFLLLTVVPPFERSALRVLPRGHLQWRVEEYLRDVNSALAGYVRAQAAAGVIVGLTCVGGFLLIGVDGAISLGVTAGVLELVPAIGPLTALLVASAQAGPHLLGVVIFLGALRVVQDYVVYPRLIRHGMHLSTPAVILTLWTGAAIAQAAGVILAIPVAGCLSVSIRHIREYRDIERLIAAGRM